MNFIQRAADSVNDKHDKLYFGATVARLGSPLCLNRSVCKVQVLIFKKKKQPNKKKKNRGVAQDALQVEMEDFGILKFEKFRICCISKL